MADRWFQTEESQRFLQALDPSALGFTFQTFGDRDKLPNLARVYNGPLDQVADKLSDLNHKGAGIYVTISRTDLAGRKRENIQRPRAVFCDFDGIEPPAGTGALPPSMVVQSKNGKHIYWLLDLNESEPDLARWELVQEALARKLGADPACKDPPRVMRLPGSQHLKSDPFEVRLLECHHERRYKLDEIVRAYGLTLTPKPKPTPRRVDAENDGPADDFNQRGDWSFLTRHGWIHLRDYGPEGRWSRPGRDPPSISATTDHDDHTGIFYVFSSSAAPFEATTAYTRFQAYSILEHGGDYKAAARDLGAQGFGKDPKQWATERARERDAALMDRTVDEGPPDDLAPRRRRRESQTPEPPPDDVPFEPTDEDAEAALSPTNNVVDLGKQRRKKEEGKKGKGKRKRIHTEDEGGSSGGPRDPQDGVIDFRVSGVRILDSDPPSWQLEIEGSKMLRLATKELDNPRMFRRRFMEVLFRRPSVPTGEGADELWQAIVNHWMEMAVVVEQPEDASDLGAVRSVLRMTLRQLATGETLDDLSHGKVLAHPSKPGISIVLGTALAGMLREAFGERVPPKVMGEALRDLMCEPDRVHVDRTRQRVWCFSPQLDEPDWTDPDSDPQGKIPLE